MYSIKEVKEGILDRMKIIVRYDNSNETPQELKSQSDVECLAKAYLMLTEAEVIENETNNSNNR